MGNYKIYYDSPSQTFVVMLQGKVDWSMLSTTTSIYEDLVRQYNQMTKHIKVLFDFQEVEWPSVDMYHSVRRSFRKAMQPCKGRKTSIAIVNRDLEGISSETGHFFVNREHAWDWLQKN